jgi:hypothetical protein
MQQLKCFQIILDVCELVAQQTVGELQGQDRLSSSLRPTNGVAYIARQFEVGNHRAIIALEGK